jgi:alkaline phosphatase D
MFRRMPRRRLQFLGFWFACALGAACARAPAPELPEPAPPPAAAAGLPLVLVGDVTPDAAVVHARAPRAGRLRAVARDASGREVSRVAVVDATGDFAAKLELGGLAPATRYAWRVWLEGAEAATASGAFDSAPLPDAARAVRFAFGGDVGGQNACRDARTGYAIFDEIASRTPDFFVGLGDMIYADSACNPIGRYGNAQVPRASAQATDLAGYRAHWRYNREDAAFGRLARTTSYVAVWDDHETVNDAGPDDDTRAETPYSGDVHLMPIALRAFLDYNPVREHPDTPNRLYRALRWGRHLELFVLDTRQYRDPDSAPDAAERPKTLLGREQRAWLERRVRESDATWKVIVSSVPIALPTGSARTGARDGWASLGTRAGYEGELRGIFRAFAEAGVRTSLWITTDVHFAAAFRHAPLPERPDFQVIELATGPLHAGIWRNETFDDTFHPEQLLLYAAPDPAAVATLDEVRRWWNFGAISIDEEGRLEVQVVNARGERVWRHRFDPP